MAKVEGERRIVVALAGLGPAERGPEMAEVAQWREETGARRDRCRLLKVECSECGYIARTTRKWLESIGEPICPCNGLRMRSEYGESSQAAVAQAERDGRQGMPVGWGDAWVTVDRARECSDCGAFHDRGALMHFARGNVGGRIAVGYFCRSWCGDPEAHVDYSGDRPPWPPETRRLVA